MVYPHGRTDGGGGVDPVRTFCGQGEGGQVFAISCGSLLWTVANNVNEAFQCCVAYAMKQTSAFEMISLCGVAALYLQSTGYFMLIIY